MDNNATDPAHKDMPEAKRILFSAISIVLGLVVALATAETILRYTNQRIQDSDRLDPGMMLYDSLLGWRLKPNWSGFHEHHDFKVQYSINPFGFRGNFNEPKRPRGQTYAIVGDSFSFGLGVNDSDTFAHKLNTQLGQKNTYLNFSVPGYSTDQELLLIKERVLGFDPDAILLVVYLGNDLFDNELPFPLQANNAKPYFELDADTLNLRNNPVPLATKPAAQIKHDLSKVVLGEADNSTNGMMRQLRRSQLFRLLESPFRRYPDLASHFESRFNYPLQLFTAIIEQLKSVCNREDIALNLILIPGRSFVEEPGSPSQQFQNYLRKNILSIGARLELKVLDLPTYLRQHYLDSREMLYHPNEGHLTTQGHRIVADYLEMGLKNNVF